MLYYRPDWKNLERQDVVDVLTIMMHRAGTSNIPGGLQRIKRIENEINLKNLTSANDSQFMAAVCININKTTQKWMIQHYSSIMDGIIYRSFSPAPK